MSGTSLLKKCCCSAGCPACDADIQCVSVTFTGFTSGWAIYNRTFDLPDHSLGPCVWEGCFLIDGIYPVAVSVVNQSGNAYMLRLTDGTLTRFEGVVRTDDWCTAELNFENRPDLADGTADATATSQASLSDCGDDADRVDCHASQSETCPDDCPLCGDFHQTLCFGASNIPFGVTVPKICYAGAFCLFFTSSCPGSHQCDPCSANISCVVDGGLAYWELSIDDILDQDAPCPPGVVIYSGPWVFRAPVVVYQETVPPCPLSCNWTQFSGPTVATLQCCPPPPIVCCT